MSTQVKGLHPAKPQITPHLNPSGFGRADIGTVRLPAVGFGYAFRFGLPWTWMIVSRI
ncbi:hypothetical protein OH786_28750 [Streptomyces atratus]|uniref:hypothetical protein n=1 Tax=Streptomyces atratus TaxID=1893 RepID=UPI0038651885